MTITIKLKTDNAAFADDRNGELRQIMDRVRYWITSDDYRRDPYGLSIGQPLMDTNGNTVGSVKVTGK